MDDASCYVFPYEPFARRLSLSLFLSLFLTLSLSTSLSLSPRPRFSVDTRANWSAANTALATALTKHCNWIGQTWSILSAFFLTVSFISGLRPREDGLVGGQRIGRATPTRPTGVFGPVNRNTQCVTSNGATLRPTRSDRSVPFFFRRFFFRRHRHRPHPRGRERFEWTLKTMQPVASNKSMSGRRSARRRVEEKRGSMTGNHLSSAAVKGGGISEGRLILRTIAGMRCGRHRFTTAKKKYNNKPKQTRRRRRWK